MQAIKRKIRQQNIESQARSQEFVMGKTNPRLRRSEDEAPSARRFLRFFNKNNAF